MDCFNNIEMYRYEIGSIINNNRNTIYVTNDIEIANEMYEKAIKQHNNENDHVIIFLYDYDKNTNINYYDSTEIL